MIVLGTIAIVLITIAVGVLVDRKHSILPKPTELMVDKKPPPQPATHGAGEAPATAIRTRASQLAKLRAQRCPTCRAEMRNDADDTVRYDERELIVLHFTCPACAARRTLYVERV
jgi:RNase P subunit RPR2